MCGRLSAMHRLCDAEVRLVMHCLPLSSVLTLARCSRQLLTAAAHSHAWPHYVSFPLVRSDGEVLYVADMKDRIEGSLLRFAKKRALRLVFSSYGGIKFAREKLKELLELPGVSIVRNLTGVGRSDVRAALLTPAWSGKLKVYEPYDVTCTLELWEQLLRAQPALEILEMMVMPSDMKFLQGVYPNITDLHLLIDHDNCFLGRLERTFPALQRLILDNNPHGRMSPWSAIKLPPTTHSLRLSIKGFCGVDWTELPVLFPHVRTFCLHVVTDQCADPEPGWWINLFQALRANPDVCMKLSFRAEANHRSLKWAVEDGSEFVRDAFPERFALALNSKDPHRFFKQAKKPRMG